MTTQTGEHDKYEGLHTVGRPDNARIFHRTSPSRCLTRKANGSSRRHLTTLEHGRGKHSSEADPGQAPLVVHGWTRVHLHARTLQPVSLA
jgi:hypothetical protein